jgi:hypothetical protein
MPPPDASLAQHEFVPQPGGIIVRDYPYSGTATDCDDDLQIFICGIGRPCDGQRQFLPFEVALSGGLIPAAG